VGVGFRIFAPTAQNGFVARRIVSPPASSMVKLTHEKTRRLDGPTAGLNAIDRWAES
jgi:hypothetical protein